MALTREIAKTMVDHILKHYPPEEERTPAQEKSVAEEVQKMIVSGQMKSQKPEKTVDEIMKMIGGTFGEQWNDAQGELLEIYNGERNE